MQESLSMIFGVLREIRGLTIEELALKVEISSKTLSELENGKFCDVETLHKLAAFYDRKLRIVLERID